MKKEIVFGNRFITVELPERVKIIKPEGISLPLDPVEPFEEIERVLNKPLDAPPLHSLVNEKSRVTIAFDDPTAPCFAPVWYAGIKGIIKELERAGVKKDNVTLLCANGLHRKFTVEEISKVTGEEIVREFEGRILCHDAEDRENLVYLGKTRNGYDVEVNRLVLDSDLLIYLNTVVSRGFNGGWKSICVGLSTWRSIKCHHTPEIMSMSLERNRMHEILDEMGEVVEEKAGKGKIFKIETLLANPFQVGKMFAGSVWATRRELLKIAGKFIRPRKSVLDSPVDVVCYGIPDWSPYATFSFMNPILTLSSTGLGYLGGYIEALGKPGCTVILATPCPDQWNEVHHPSYREVWERVLPVTKDPHEIMKIFEGEFLKKQEYIEKYRFGNAFHPIHGLLALQPLKRARHAGKIIVAGIEKPHIAQQFGFETSESVEEAIEMAERIHGKNCSIALIDYPMAGNRV